MGLNVSSASGVEVVGTLDIDFTDDIFVTDDGDGTVTLNAVTDKTLTDYNNVRGFL